MGLMHQPVESRLSVNQPTNELTTRNEVMKYDFSCKAWMERELNCGREMLEFGAGRLVH